MGLKGFDELEKQLKKIEKSMTELDGKHEVSLLELMPDSFMSKNSNYTSLQELFDSSGFKIDSVEDFSEIPDEKWDAYINSSTTFENWDQMQEEALNLYIGSKIGFC
ncbi:hypothetical protein [Photobacterium carnosum]|uniref:hypothetical protein n=1 Tax=Photobacterium carnosum TaxID=2023717 RepID=UPI001E3F429D|nr:hypothetical protein [Photobacterium carnosum]MCD9539591.1 hypothetical protein [Photobacterium carnosum]MCF2164022.1 hypothetical protein [Photobacterium carnosum]